MGKTAGGGLGAGSSSGSTAGRVAARYRAREARLRAHVEQLQEQRGIDPERIGSCPRCGGPVRWKGTGRKPRWCSATCRTRAKEARRAARDGERALEVVDGPAKADNAAGWARMLADPGHEDLLRQVLAEVAREYRRFGRVVPAEADAVVEAMFALPDGSGARLRAGLPLPDADVRAETVRVQQFTAEKAERELRRLEEIEREAYERGHAAGHAQRWTEKARTDRAWGAQRHSDASAGLPTVVGEQYLPGMAVPDPQAGMSRQQRRAAERAARKNGGVH